MRTDAKNVRGSSYSPRVPWSSLTEVHRELVHHIVEGKSTKITSAFSHCVVKSERLSLEDDRRGEDYYYEASHSLEHSINLELNEESMKPANAPRNAGVDPSTMKMNQLYKGRKSRER